MKEKLYYPAYASMRYKDCDDYDDMDYWRDDLSQSEAAHYTWDILEAIEKDRVRSNEKTGLMDYFSCNNKVLEQSIKEKVLYAIPTVEVIRGQLFGVMEMEIKEPLSAQEMITLKEDMLGSLSDGWGEGFEQREIKTGDGDLYVSFWSSDKNYFIDTREEFDNRMGIAPAQDFSDGQSFTQQM